MFKKLLRLFRPTYQIEIKGLEDIFTITRTPDYNIIEFKKNTVLKYNESLIKIVQGQDVHLAKCIHLNPKIKKDPDYILENQDKLIKAPELPKSKDCKCNSVHS